MAAQTQPQSLLAQNEQRSESGRIALLGFYYQLLDSASLSALQCSLLPSEADDSIIALAKFIANQDCTFVPEIGGEDLGILAGENNVLVQYKHTTHPEHETVGIPIIRSVIIGLAQSLTYLEAKYNITADHINACVLITNRTSTPILQKVKAIAATCRNKLLDVNLESPDGKQPRATFDALSADVTLYETETVTFSGQGLTSFEGTVSELCDRWIYEALEKTETNEDTEVSNKIAEATKTNRGKQKLTENDRQTLKKAVLHVLPRFFVIYDHDFDKSLTQFETFAHSHGATESEIREARRQLVGNLMEMSIDGGTLKVEDLNRVVTGSETARMLTKRGIGDLCHTDWKVHTGQPANDHNWMVPRYGDKLIELISDGCRIISLVGSGGCGKTELLRQFLTEYADGLIEDKPFQGFVIVESAHDLDDESLKRAFLNWSRRSEMDNLFTRLRCANRNTSNLLWIGLDGVDEHRDSHQHRIPPGLLRDILHQIREQNSKHDIYLLLTCRDTEIDELERQLQPPGLRGDWRSNSQRDYRRITVSEFTPDELAVAASRGLPPDLASEIQAASQPSIFAPTNASSVNKDVLDSLCHPRMFGAMVNLVMHHPEQGRKALQGDTEGLYFLSRIFLHFYLHKYDDRHRNQNFPLPNKEEYISMLQHLAKTGTQGGQFKRSQWHSEASVNHPDLTRQQAQVLFEETLSGGLIKITDPSTSKSQQWWEWRHQFVLDCLVKYPVTDWLEDQC